MKKNTPYFGIYVKKGDSYAFLKKSEFKNLLLYRTERELYTYKSQKRFLYSFQKTLDRSYSLIRMYKCYNLELSEQ